MNQKTNINTLAGQNFFNSHIQQLINELAQAKITFSISKLQAETGEIKAYITLAQAETTDNQLQAFNIKVWLYNNNEKDQAMFRLFLEHNKGTTDYPRTAEERQLWSKQFTNLEYDFVVNNLDLKQGSATIRNDSTGNINLYTFQAVSKIVELAKTLQTAKE
jgi:aspartyl-tRNA synthetase